MRLFFLLVFSLATTSFAQSLGEIAESGGSVKMPTQKAVQETKTSSAKVDIDDIINKASSGDATAQFALGSYFVKGEHGLPKDAVRAIEWLEKSANQKNAPAMSYLGYLYAEGKLIPRDMKKAVQWREAGAECGDVATKWTLGNAYLYGFMVPKDHVKALYWITRSAEGGYIEAIKKLVEIYTKLENADELAKWKAEYSKAQILLAEGGDVDAMFDLAEKYMKGKDGLPRHRVKAIYWYRKAADAGNIKALDKLANMYAKGLFLPQNLEKALSYYEKLAMADVSYCFKVSSYYAEGKNGFPQDAKKSLQWYARGAEKGDSTTRMYLVWRYWREGDLQNATAQCKLLIDETDKKIQAMKSSSATAMQLEVENKKLRILNKMMSDISSGAVAPANLNNYYNSIK